MPENTRKADLVKESARKRIRYAVSIGRVIRQPCEVCGGEQVEAHHDDYTQALAVRWLCRPCHNAWHVKNDPANSENNVKRLRVRLGWTQERMAREIGVSYTTINRWENGRAVPRGLSVAALLRLARTPDANALVEEVA